MSTHTPALLNDDEFKSLILNLASKIGERELAEIQEGESIPF
jgi:hypothetical protein